MRGIILLDKVNWNSDNPAMSYEAEFGSVLKKLRLAHNLSQVELSALSQMDRTFISLLERGIRQPTLTTIFNLAKALQMKPHELVAQVEMNVRRTRWGRLKR